MTLPEPGPGTRASTRRTALVLGGGFGGVESAIQLARRGLDVTLVSDRPGLFLYPVSIWVPLGGTTLDDVTLDLADLARRHGFRFRLGRVTAVHPAERAATVDGDRLTADALVLALGGGRLKPPGAEHTHTICGAPSDTERFRDALQALRARGAGRIAVGFGGNPADPSAVRGGPAFEMMFNLDTWLRRLRLRERFTLTFFAPMASPGQRMGEGAVVAVDAMFDRLGIGKRFGRRITGFDAGGVAFEDGSRLDADLVLFVGAVGGHPVLREAGLPVNEAGFVRIDEGCAVPGLPGVYAVGDAAALEGPDWRAKQGHLAEVMAGVAAHNLAVDFTGAGERESYLPHVGILCVMDMGDGAAWVARDRKRAIMIPLPIVGHWLKRGWRLYYRLSRQRRLPRLPGM